MRKQFDEWLRVRANIIAKTPPSKEAVVAESWPWEKNPQKDPRKWRNRPKSRLTSEIIKDPHVELKVGEFAHNLGLGNLNPSKQISLYNSLATIYIARTYGTKYGAVEEGHLANVWNALQYIGKGQTQTIAQMHGIIRPWSIISKVPDAVAGETWGYTHEAKEFDTHVWEGIKKNRSGVRPAGTEERPPAGEAPLTQSAPAAPQPQSAPLWPKTWPSPTGGRAKGLIAALEAQMAAEVAAAPGGKVDRATRHRLNLLKHVLSVYKAAAGIP